MRVERLTGRAVETAMFSRNTLSRRECLKLGALGIGALMCGGSSAAVEKKKEVGRRMKLGLVTYNIANDWELPLLIERCKTIGIEGVELRTTHAHGVEPALSKAERADVRKRFEDSGIVLWGLGSICEFHSDDPAVVKQNVETCKAFTLLAEDLDAKGVKVRPNRLMVDKGIPEEKTLEQVGLALRACGEFASDHGIEIWCEVHGPDTCHPPRMRKMLDIADHPSVGACWNSNQQDIVDGSVRPSFDLLKPYLRSCHINELWKPQYPWQELFSLLKKADYDRFTLAEIPPSSDPERVLRYYRALWQELAK